MVAISAAIWALMMTASAALMACVLRAQEAVFGDTEYADVPALHRCRYDSHTGGVVRFHGSLLIKCEVRGCTNALAVHETTTPHPQESAA